MGATFKIGDSARENEQYYNDFGYFGDNIVDNFAKWALALSRN